MKKLVIIGAGDFGREVAWLVERINAKEPTWELLGFADDNPTVQGLILDGYSVLGTTQWLQTLMEETYVVCSIGTGRVRKLVMERVLKQKNLQAATLVDPAAIVGRNAVIGPGCIVCAGSIISIDAELTAHVILNLNCTIGHDAVLHDYCTVNPGSNVSGKVCVGESTDLGTGVKVIQGLHLCGQCIVGAGSVVVKNIEEPGTYVGVPVRIVH